MMRPARVSEPTRSARMCRWPSRSSVDANTGWPIPRKTGIDSPVSWCSSISALPWTTLPSTGMRSPG